MTENLEAVNAKRALRVASVQMESENGNIAGNLKHATGFVEEAAKRGAKLILLPEFMATGYSFTEDIWDSGEPKEGPTVKWLKETSKRLGVWLGASYLEAEGEDFYNTFVLTNPQGKEDGRVRKQLPAGPEACFNAGGEAGPHIINTELGKIGVAICYENLFAYTVKNMFSNSADLMLQPLSAPTIVSTPKIIQWYKDMIATLSTNYAKNLGIPAILSNKSGKWNSPVPHVPILSEVFNLKEQVTHFCGFATIADSDGSLKAQLGIEEGIIVGDVIMDPALKKKSMPKTYGKWAIPDKPILFKLAFLLEAVYASRYRSSKKRKLKAKAISQS